MQKRYGHRGLVIVGVHTPEFDREKSRANVEAAVEKFGLSDHSHFMDNRMVYWRALRNQYWPALYVVDSKGRIRSRMFGEIRVGARRDRDLSALVESLIAESAAKR